MTLNGTPGQALIAYYAEPGTPHTTRSHCSTARKQTTSASLTSDASSLTCAPDPSIGRHQPRTVGNSPALGDINYRRAIATRWRA
jgi:hypothetical protein